jgi:Na+/proline symporter
MSERLILWGIVIAYMIFIFTKGVLKVRKVGTSDDFLVAGRNVGWFMLFATMGATVIGGGYSIGNIGNTYEFGILWLLVSTGGYFHFIFSGLVVAPQFREAELYTVAGYFGHRYGEKPRFLVLILSLLFSVFIVAAQMAAFGTVLSAILPEFADSQSVLRWAIIIGGSMVVIYSTAGGLLAVIHTDLFQFLVLLGGFAITLLFCIPSISDSYNSETGKFVPNRFGTADFVEPVGLSRTILNSPDSVSRYIREGITATEELSMESLRRPVSDSAELRKELVDVFNYFLVEKDFYSKARFAHVNLSPQTLELMGADLEDRDLRKFNLSLIQDTYPDEIERNRQISANFFKIEGGMGWMFLITTFLAFFLGETFAPGYATRYCIGKDIKNTRIGIAGVGFFLAITFPVVLFFIALYARVHYPDIDPQQALPMVVQTLNNPVIGGLMIGALLMAVMSSADSALNSSTAIFVKDLFEHQLGWTDKGDGKILRLARICTALLGVTAILIAVLWSDIIGLLLFTYHVWAPAIILPVSVGAIYKKRSSTMTRNIFITMLAATVITLLYRFIMVLEDKFDFAIFSERIYEFMNQFDPAVFGVGVSIISFTVLTVFSALFKSRSRPQ